MNIWVFNSLNYLFDYFFHLNTQIYLKYIQKKEKEKIVFFVDDKFPYIIYFFADIIFKKSEA